MKIFLFQDPHIEAVMVNDPGHMNLPIGGVVYYDLMIKIPPLGNTKIMVKVTRTTNMKVCLVKLMEFGTNLPCVRDDLNATVNLLDTELDLGIVSNLCKYLQYLFPHFFSCAI